MTVMRTALLALWCVGCATAGGAPEHSRLVEAKRSLEEGVRLLQMGKYVEAVPHAERTLALRREVLGSSHPEVAEGLQLLGAVHLMRGEYKQAEPLLVRARATFETALGPGHPSVARALNDLANLYQAQGEYTRAEPLYERALAIFEQALGPGHLDVARSLNSLAGLYKTQGLYARAESLYERALAIREEALGPSHPDVATLLNNLAALHDAQAQYTRATPLYERTLAIFEEALGPGHPHVATSLNNLANLYQTQGEYTRAEPLYERALAIREQVLGPGHPHVATSLNNLAGLLQAQGQYARAEPLYERALAIRVQALGPGHANVAGSLDNLARLYQAQGQSARAEPLYERALAIFEEALGPGHPNVATALTSLASLHKEQGRYTRAEPLLERALAIFEQVLGPGHPSFATSLNNLALLYQAQRQYTRAEPLLERALAIFEQALGPGHPSSATSLNNLARLRLAQQRFHEALPLFERAFAHFEAYLRTQALVLSEERLASFLQQRRMEEERIYALLRAHPEDPRVRRLALATSLLRKGRSAEELANASRTIYRGLGVEDRATFEQLKSLRAELASLSLAGPRRLAPADYQRRLKDLTEQGDRLETLLARRSAPLRALKALPLPEQIVDRVADALPEDGALVEFVAYQDKPSILELDTPRAQVSSEPRYLALILLADGRTGAVDLGSAAPMDRAIQRLRDALAQRNISWQPAAEQLYRLAFHPLLPVLGKTRRLFLAPDGQLALVPFDALHDGRRSLIDGFDLAYLDSGKDLLPRSGDVAPSGSVIVLADPDLSARSVAVAGKGSPAERSPAVEQFFSTQCRDTTSLGWGPLPDTRQEAKAIKRLLPQARVLLGGEATKEALLQVKAPGILHIATHGFFLEDIGSTQQSRGAVESVGQAGAAQCPADPLLRSGLVLAGAQAPATEAGPPRRESSLVTALELAGVDLWGTQLVVLSACDTGRGDVRPGQGVYGLRRALAVAGAQTVVMSLWKVNDETTRQLMEAYYRHLLAGGGRTQALREAMKALRKVHPHPYHWAAFLAVGQQAPLRGLVPPPPPR